MSKNLIIKIVGFVLIIIFVIIIISFVSSKNKESEENKVIVKEEIQPISMEEIEKISSILMNIIEDEEKSIASQIKGSKISYEQAKSYLSNIDKNINIKLLNNYDKYEIESKYFYYKISAKDFESFGIKQLNHEYIVNYSTKEVMDITAKKENEEVQKYSALGDYVSAKVLNKNFEKYTITYDLDGGIITVPFYVKEYDKSMNFYLPDVQMDGYEFIGWTGSNGKVPQSKVYVEEGTTGNLIFKANFKKYEDIESMVAE